MALQKEENSIAVLIRDILIEAGFSATDHDNFEIQQFQTTLHNLQVYIEQLYFWNKTVNLTGFKGREEMALKHVGDSALLLSKLSRDTSLNLLDIGTGAGVPGLILKILEPLATTKFRIVLVDAVRKKVSFLRHVIGILGLKGIEALHLRLGEQDNVLRERLGLFDVITSQAVGELDLLWRLGSPFMTKGSVLIALKGERASEEIALWRKKIAGKGQECLDISLSEDFLPIIHAKRTFVFVQNASL